MNLRLSSLRAMFNLPGASRLTAAVAVSAALVCAGVGSATAAPGDAASAPEAASVSYANGGQVTVRPGQSLNDVAIAVTQSHDKATLARASRALFDANPNAFMSHDPSRLRLGAVLTVPVLDASGALAASAAGVAAAPASAPNVAPATDAASAVAQANAGAASAASAAAPAAPAVSAVASAATEASSATPGSTGSSAPIAGSQAAALPASGTHAWSGSIQPSASEAEGASAAGAGTTPATTAAQPASQPRAQVSSLQQLLALKNRVLMELQKHGIGGTPPATNTASTGVAQPAVGVSSAAAVPSHGSTPVASTSSDAGMSQTELSVAAAIGAALVALLAALRMGRRKRERLAADAASADGDTAVSARATGPQDVVSTREQIPERGASDVGDDSAVGNAAALAAAEREAAEGDAAAREMAERVAAEREAEIRQAAAREAAEKAADHAAAERAAAEQAAAEHSAAERTAAEQAAAEHAAGERTAAEQATAEHAAAERTAAEQAAAEHATAERTAAEQAEAEHAAAERTAAEQAEAERAAAERATAERAAENQPTAGHKTFPSPDLNAPDHISQERDAAPASVEPAQLSPNVAPSAQGGLNPEPLPTPHHDDFDSATTAASLAAAAELGAEALPLAPLEPVDDAFLHEEPAHRLQWDDTPAARLEPSIESQRHLNVPPAVDFTQPHVEPHSPPAFGQSHSDAASPAKPLAEEAQQAHSEPAHEPHQPVQALSSDASPTREPASRAQPQSAPAAVPTEFPRDAVDAFGSLDMPLPPRVESSADALQAPASLSSQPVASPETTAQQAAPLPHPDDDTPHIADEITAGTAGHAAVAGLGAGFGTGLGAAGFGALKLDFDLELPPSPAQPLPAFTQSDLSRIARNKLELAAEYIELGDLSGARALINEVIETNDPGTRTEARALLSTLAPLS
ncbi:FimV-like protein [Paraburkholderia sp. BL18I3N2]|uniref:FimV/HubP family polar landmark protein n=1 Tax=Paraburkholderia sp. BL18I3N2 TaxID=1938799 RepID=UPI000D048D33|nr:FimV/HubP family polar landmark protein [Paraburkholderia sp. BL18I3N2]PRX27935.1 FimV-like protein [Paraburkholderia sp. BL18I3N2]